MMPILFEANTTDFSTMGIGMLSEATKVHVKRVLNGKDELELQYPVNGKMFNELINTRHILAVPEYKKSPQAYTIYRVSKPMNGVVTVNARHISERRMFTMVKPFSFGSVTEMFNALPDYLVDSNSPFTFYTDKSVVANCERAVPSSLGAVLGGTEGSALDVYGGEYEFDMFHVKLLTRRGVDHGVSVEYGKNLKALEVLQSVDESVITGVCPIWTGMEEGQQMFLPEYIVKNSVHEYPFDRIVVVDFSSEFDDKPTETQLRDAAQAYISRAGIGVPSLSIKVTFEHLAQFEEYKSFSALEVLNLGDSVSIHHADLDVDITARIVETAYDVLAEKYTSVTVGRVRSDMSTTIMGITKDMDKKVKESKNFVAEGVRNATELITGAQGGYVVFNRDLDGHPYEILIMDTDDKLTATNCIRINKNGIGFSTNGYQGPFNTAWTIDGAFVADYITSGTLNANVIKAGILSDAQNKNYWNLQTGEFRITDGTFHMESGGKIFYASDYTADDTDRIRNIIYEQLEPTIEELEKYDFNQDGKISMLDLIVCRDFVNGTLDSYQTKAAVTLDPANDEKVIVVSSGRNDAWNRTSYITPSEMRSAVFKTGDNTGLSYNGLMLAFGDGYIEQTRYTSQEFYIESGKPMSPTNRNETLKGTGRQLEFNYLLGSDPTKNKSAIYGIDGIQLHDSTGVASVGIGRNTTNNNGYFYVRGDYGTAGVLSSQVYLWGPSPTNKKHVELGQYNGTYGYLNLYDDIINSERRANLEYTGLKFYNVSGAQVGYYPPNFKFFRQEVTLNQQYCTLNDSQFRTDSVVFAQIYYSGNQTSLTATVTPQITQNGACILYFRMPSGTIPDGTKVWVQILIIGGTV